MFKFQNGILEKNANLVFQIAKNYQINGKGRQNGMYLMKVQKKRINVIYNLIVKNLVMTNIKDGEIRESSMGDDHPIVWTNYVGKGKPFYSAMGHKGKYIL